EDADLRDLVRMAITGQVRLAGWDPGPRYLAALGAAATGGPSALSADQFMQRTPCARTRQWLTVARISAAAPPPVLCVIGDTAADYALAVLCDRLFHRAGWIPMSIWNDQKLASAAKLGIYELGHIPGLTKPAGSGNQHQRVSRDSPIAHFRAAVIWAGCPGRSPRRFPGCF